MAGRGSRRPGGPGSTRRGTRSSPCCGSSGRRGGWPAGTRSSGPSGARTGSTLPRRDQLAVRRLLDGWDAHVALDGTLRPWEAGETLPAQTHDIWVREHPGGPWRFQLMLDETDGEQWVCRRAPASAARSPG
ncbi:hypothetical protein ACIBP6_05040 [Nonomuraea terrae]|uniref:hypothetical protein n=1 Tax=Nonomuraea terrae TaxID=2530383 RepID=UPI0037AB9A0E